jgi:hypothetical protein
MINDNRTISQIKRLLISLEFDDRIISDLEWRNGRFFVTLSKPANKIVVSG